MHEDSSEVINIYYNVFYHTYSSLDEAENNRYGQQITGQITRTNETASETIEVGRITAFKLLLDLAYKNGWDAFSIFDVDQSTLDIGSVIYDFEGRYWNNVVVNYYDDNIEGTDLLIGSRIEILPAYRGQGIGKKAIKDLYNNFIQGCGLFAIKCFPLQSEVHIKENTQPFVTSMCYDQMEQDRKTAFRKLSAFYKSIGFQTIPGLSKEIMLINPLKVNKKFEAIELD